ncbi:MAG TPA: hypothetical protein ENO24_07065 [Chloroflexi bacterium]|nr:hypothetical protein [Chloroflexota bacterium]
MSWLDVVVGLLFVAGLAGGYFQGLIRQALSLGALLSGLILATYARVPLAAFLAYTFPEVRASTRETVAFLFSVAVLVSVLEVVQRKAMPETRLLSIGVLDRLAGALVAVVSVSFQLGVAILVLQFLLGLRWPVGETMRLLLISGAESSLLVPALTNLVATFVIVVGRLQSEGKPAFLDLG